MILTPEEIRTLEAWNLRFIAELHAATAREHELAGRDRFAQVSRWKSKESMTQAHQLDPATKAERVPCFVVPLETSRDA